MSAPNPILEAEAIADWKAGDRRAGDTLLRMHEGLIRSVVKHYVTARAEFDDLMQLGRMALLRAAQRHDAAQSKLSTYAMRRIRAIALQYMRGARFIINVSKAEKRARETTRFPMWLDAPMGEYGWVTLHDYIATPEPEEDTSTNVTPLLAVLPPHERDIIQRHYGDSEETLEQIGKARGVTKQAAHDMKNRALARMRFAAGLTIEDPRCAKRNATLAAGRAAHGVAALKCSRCGEERHNRRTCPLRQSA